MEDKSTVLVSGFGASNILFLANHGFADERFSIAGAIKKACKPYCRFTCFIKVRSG
jgi:hypothetical protein